VLYVTTRNEQEAFTVQHVLNRSRGEDGGLYLPLHFPVLSEAELNALAGKSFNQRVADLLNLFFSTKLTLWDIDFSAGRYPVRLEAFPNKLWMAELWHNPDWRYARLEGHLLELIGTRSAAPGSWCTIAVRMAILGAILGERSELGDGTVDLVMVSGDFTVPISAWYLRKMGFPVGNIVCCCNENNQLWELFCHGQMRTDDAVISSVIPEADVALPVNLERLISGCGGREAVTRYLYSVSNSFGYSASDAMLQELRKGLYVSVVSSNRVETAIPNIYNSYRYLMTPASALAYSGLMDYRSKTGINRPAVVLCDNSPACDADRIQQVMGLTPAEFNRMMR